MAVAIDALRANKLRAMLTSLGVIIGSASVVLVVTVALTSRAGKRSGFTKSNRTQMPGNFGMARVGSLDGSADMKNIENVFDWILLRPDG